MIFLQKVMKILLLISTFGPDGLSRAAKVPVEPREDVFYLVSWQYDTTQAPETVLSSSPLSGRPDVIVKMVEGKGLSANRNHTLSMADEFLHTHSGSDAADKDAVAWILDDDVRLLPEGIDEIRSTFEIHREVDVACFQVMTPDGAYYKKYPVADKKLNRFEDLRKVSSVEIAFRMRAVLEAGIRFDERFGIGSPIICGEEAVFLHTALRNGLTISYYPLAVVVHAKESSVNRKSPYDDDMLRCSGAVNAVVYGAFAARVRHLLSVWKARKSLKDNHIPVCHFLRMKNAGMRFIENSNNK